MVFDFRRENASTLNRTHGYDMFWKVMAPMNSTYGSLQLVDDREDNE